MDDANGLKGATLSVNVFTAPGKAMVGERPKPFGDPFGFDPTTSTLIFGEYDAVLVDAMTTVAEAEALADWIVSHNRNSGDHLYNARPFRPLLRFGDSARPLLGRSGDSNAQDGERHADVSDSSGRVQSFAGCFLGKRPTKLVAPEPYEQSTSTLEGQELRIIEQGHTDSADTTSLYVPSISLIVAGDVVYNQCRTPDVGDTTSDS